MELLLGIIVFCVFIGWAVFKILMSLFFIDKRLPKDKSTFITHNHFVQNNTHQHIHVNEKEFKKELKHQ